LVLPDRGLIAFPAEDGFVVFSYSPKTGFTQRSSMRFVDAYNSRGVVIEDLLYVCAPTGIGVFRLDTFSLLTHLTF